MYILSTHLQVSTKEFLMRRTFSSERLAAFQTQSSEIPATAQEHSLNTHGKVLWCLGMPLWVKQQESSQLIIGAALPALIQSALLNLSANSYKKYKSPTYLIAERGDLREPFQYLKGPTRKLERGFLQGHGEKGQGVMVSC